MPNQKDKPTCQWSSDMIGTVNQKLNLILLILKNQSGTLSPELEAAFQQLEIAVQKVDDKIPDTKGTQ